MKLTTTLALALLVAASVALYVMEPRLPFGEYPVSVPVESTSTSIPAALKGLTPDHITHLAVRKDGQPVVVLDRRDSGWIVSNGWPANPAEVQPLLDLIAQLHTRFTPIRADSAEERARYGLDHPALTVEVRWRDGAGADKATLALGEPAGDSFRFVRPTYLHLEGTNEVLRLAPGLIELLGRPADLYRQRRLFPSERTVRLNNPQERIERLNARKLLITQKDATPLRLARTPDGWELREPTRDRLDPDNAEKLLSAVADLWAEQFVEMEPATAVLALVPPTSPLVTACSAGCLSPAVVLKRTGLDKPERTITVTRNDGSVTTLHLGKASRGDEPPPPVPPRGPAPETFHYAKLASSDLIFEVQGGKLNDIFVTLETLRDARLARFNTDDAERLEIQQGKQSVVLVRENKDSWKMLSPRDVAADNDKVKDLLNKLSALEAADKDLLSPAHRAAFAAGALASLAGPSLANVALAGTLTDADAGFGLDQPAGEVKVLVREKARPEDRDRSKERTIAVRLGKPGWPDKRLYLQALDRPRIDATDDSLWPLIEKPTSLYRGKQPLEFTASDVQRLEIRRLDLPALSTGVIGLLTRPSFAGRLAATAALAGDRSMHLVLTRQGDEWNITSPVTTSADTIKVNDLIDAAGKFKVLAFEADNVPTARLQRDYGLGVPELTVTLTFKDAKKPPRTLTIGRPRDLEPGYFARLDGPADVFVLPGELHDQLERTALSYLPSTLWQIAADDEITRFKIAKKGQEEYELVRQKDDWQVTGPFTVTAPTKVVEQLTTTLTSPRAEEYRVFAATDLAPFGLARPEVKLTLWTQKGKEHTLLLGAETSSGKQGRFARLGSSPGVFVVGDALAKAVDQSALDFLDRTLLKFDPLTVNAVVRQQGGTMLELVREDEEWKITKPTEHSADDRKVPDLLRQLGDLKAERIVAYKPKDLSTYGLDKPEATLTIKRSMEGKAVEDVLLVGKDDGRGERFAMVKGAPAVGVLPLGVVRQVLAKPLAFRDHLVARVPDADTLKLEAGERKVTFARPEGTWKVTEPITADADHDALEAFFNGLARLRASELVAEKPTQAQLKTFGLDKPAAKWHVFNFDERKLDLVIGATEGPSGRRYARLAEGDLVFLLDEKLSGQAVAEYRPRTVWKESIDPAQVEAVRFGYAKDSFEIRKVDGNWQVVGKPEVKLNEATVSDTLSALRDLKLQRYIKDAGAQLKLYELDPPALVLEVTAPAGKFTLHIGGLLGGTKQRYARVPASKQADVFVLDEAASTKLFRDLMTLTKPLPGGGLPGLD